jgi:phosphoribosyl 1,2-cyclic phosphodiesterase
MDERWILVDIGIPKTRVEKRLIENGINPADIDAIFLTHAHKDHVQGLPFAEKWNIPVYASEGTWKTVKVGKEELEFYFNPWDSKVIDNVQVDSFQTSHDDFDSFGYVITNGKTQVSICLDTGKVDASMIEAMRGSDVYIIESNYDDMLLQEGSYHDALKARIASDLGHLSNEQTAEALAQLVTGNGEKIYLCHLSSANNMPALAAGEVRRALSKKGITNYSIEVV